MTDVITAQDRAREKLRAKAMDQPRDDKGRFVPRTRFLWSGEYVSEEEFDRRFFAWKVEYDSHPADAISVQPQEPTLTDPAADDVPERDRMWIFVWLLAAAIVATPIVSWFWTPIMRWL